MKSAKVQIDKRVMWSRHPLINPQILLALPWLPVHPPERQGAPPSKPGLVYVEPTSSAPAIRSRDDEQHAVAARKRTGRGGLRGEEAW